jgi:chaperonin cofactor prefoldin
MSLDATPEPTLNDLKGRLETIESAWSLATTPRQRATINEDFKRLAESIQQKYGAEGKRVVDEVVRKHQALQRPR